MTNDPEYRRLRAEAVAAHNAARVAEIEGDEFLAACQRAKGNDLIQQATRRARCLRAQHAGPVQPLTLGSSESRGAGQRATT